MRQIGIVTVARSDYGIYRPLLNEINKRDDLCLEVFVGGMHLSPQYGLTVRDIEKDGVKITDRIEMLLSSETAEGASKSLGLGIIGFAQSFTRFRPDLLVVLGDRLEMYAAAAAALPLRIPVAHIHGGELTEGAIDDLLRHSITKLSHLHFVAHETYRKRVVQMGEEPWRVTVSGAPGLDNLGSLHLATREELEQRYSLDLRDPFLLVTYHPVTLEYEQTETQMANLLQALDEVNMNVLFTYPNADTGSHTIIRMLDEYVASHERCKIVVNLGTEDYFSVMQHAALMVGNSSSGIIEAASLKLPVVNIGSRQRGRLRGDNVFDVGNDKLEIVSGIRRALEPDVRKRLADLVNPYGDGNAAVKIVDVLASVRLDEKLLIKKFHEI